ncbi:MAG: DPP IV N-terminal domain-containing protein [Crocinitomicaceae bacterium]|nr:DPP IV N-terminal domain-containing protein [Crocinitomicaceae bacterium]
MFKKLIFIGFCLISSISISQTKSLTLKDAVMNQYRAFVPDQMIFFKWIPETENYTYLKGYVTLMKGSVTEKPTQWFTIAEVNEILGSKLNWFSGMEWKDSKTFWLTDGANYYSFNTELKTGKKIVSVPENGENATIEPKTEKVAFTIENNLSVTDTEGKTHVITKNKDKNIVSGQTYARSEFGITNGIFWSPKGSYLAFAQKDESEVHNYPLLDINPTPGELKSIKYPMTGQKSEKPKIGIYSFKTRKAVYICPRGDADFYLTNVSWSSDESYLLIAEVNRDQNHMWLNKYDAKSGKFIKTLFEETNDKWIEPEHPAFFPADNSTDFVWISERDGFNNLYLYDIDGNLKTKLTNNKFVTKNIHSSTLNGQEIVFEATGENPTNSLFYAVDMNGKQRLLTTNEGTHSVWVSSNGKWIFDEYSNHDTPSKSLLLDGTGKEVQTLMTSENKLADYKIGKTEISSLTANDGTKLYTRLIKPSDFDASKKYPVLVYVYGGPHAQMITNSWLDGSSLWMHWMAEQGYLIYTLDNRGSGERGFAFESGIHRRLGDLEMEDQLTGVEYLKSLPYVDGNRLAVHGWSFGGFMTTSLLLRHPDVFQVGVAGGPVTDWKYYEAMYGERYMDRPEQNPEGYKKSSLLNYADKLKGDLLLIHGTVDDVVVMQHNLALVKKFVDNGIQMDFFPYPMHKHNVGGKDRVHLMEKVLNYVIEKNK